MTSSVELPLSALLPADMRRADATDVPTLRRLVNAAYKELADAGWNFTGTYQDENETLARMQNAEVFVICAEDNILASINLKVKPLGDRAEELCLYINQLAVLPAHKRRGLGSRLLTFAEERARELGISKLRLDTARPAVHLIRLYEQRGYRVVSKVQWEGKTYPSVIMEKIL